MFDRTSKTLGKFLRESLENLQLSYENNTWDRINHALATDGPNELQQCILLGASYVQRVVHALKDHFLDLPVLNTSKFLSPHNYSNDDNDRITNIELWLKRILLNFLYNEEESDMCNGEIVEFLKTLWHECENKMIFEKFGVYVVAIWNDTQIGLNLCNFGQKNNCTHSIKYSYLWERISHTKYNPKPFVQEVKLEDPWCSYADLSLWAWSGMQWIGLPPSTFGETCEIEGYLRSIDSFLVTNQDCILIIQNMFFYSKILCNPNLRWHFKIKYMYMYWHSFL